MLKLLLNLVDLLTKGIRVLLGIILIIMLAIIFIQVLFRYVFNNPFVWAEELTLVLLVWYGYLIIAVLIKNEGHISLDFMYLKFNRSVKLIVDIIKYILLISFGALMIYFGYEMVVNAIGKHLPASKIPRPVLFIPMLISGILIALYSILNLLKILFPIKEGGNENV